MGYSLKELNKDDPQWEEAFRVMCLAFEQPLQGLFRLFRPVLEPGPEADEASFQEFAKRLYFEYAGGPECTWQKVVDDEGNIAGVALWRVHDTNPFEVEEDDTIYWYPEGPLRDFASSALEAFDAPRRKWGARPQVFLNILAISPSHQRKGIGKIILDWGVAKADELNYEMWLDASEFGKGLYEKYGFITLLRHDISPPVPEDGNVAEEWLKYKEELGEIIEYVMWRPVGGKYVEGEWKPSDGEK